MLAICACLLLAITKNFIVGALTDDRVGITFDAPAFAFITAPLTDDRIGINPDVLATASSYLPNSPSLHLRLAEFHAPYGNENLKTAEFHARRAAHLSPNDYRPLLALAAVHEYKEDLPAAEEALRAALRLAPGNLEAHWRLGTVLLQRRQLESLGELRIAAAGNPAYLQAALDMVWSASGGNPATLNALVPKAHLELARFLFQKSRVPESAAIFRQIPRDELLADTESSRYLNGLIGGGHTAIAYDLWLGLMKGDPGFVWNGGFESDILLDFAQFDWSIQPNNYAQVSIDRNTAHSGHRSLRIDFLGRETTRLDKEITQTIRVNKGARYRLRYYCKSLDFVAPQAPRVVLSDTVISETMVKDAEGWQEQSVEFSAEDDFVAIAIKVQPKFSYEDPTRGTVWFDDFEIVELPSSAGGGVAARSRKSREASLVRADGVVWSRIS